MKITKEQFDMLFDDNITIKQYREIIELINKRFCEICENFYRKTDKRRAWYDYGNCDRDQNGSFDPVAYREYIEVTGECIEPLVGFKNFNCGIPTRWLWEDYEKEIKEAIEKEKAKNIELKTKKSKERKQKESLKESIKSKLTPEELKIISFK